MDHAVSLVQAYLQLNGYFTSAEYPVMEHVGRSGFRSVTDIDVLAFRFPTSSQSLVASDHSWRSQDETDPGLAVPRDRIDMVIGEVKEGKVGINTGAIDPAVLRTVLLRFGCVPDDVETLLDGLRSEGSVVMPSGYQIRLVAFGAMPPGGEVPPCRIISLGHVLKYLQDYVRQNWKMLRHCQFKDPAFGFLMTLEKARRGGAGRRGSEGVEVVTAHRNERRRQGRAASVDSGDAAVMITPPPAPGRYDARPRRPRSARHDGNGGVGAPPRSGQKSRPARRRAARRP